MEKLSHKKYKYYCLKHNTTTRGTCTKCGHDNNQFSLSPKLRPPKIDNKVKFRKFLDDCPIFVNMVREHQKEAFINLLRKVKYFNKTINGRRWTNISK